MSSTNAPLGGQWVHLDAGDPVLWNRQTGRWMRIHPQTPLHAPSPPLLRHLRSLGFVDLQMETRFPARTRWCLLLPESNELWHACPLERTAGGLPFQSQRLDDEAIALWRACDGQHTLGQICGQTGLTLTRATEILATWTDVTVQAIQLRPERVRAREPGLAHLLTRNRPAHTRENHHYREGATTLTAYHESQITDGSTHFDDREITFAHSFEVPHPALRGREFGRALAEALTDWGADLQGQILEIGPGTGALCEAMMLAEKPKQYTRLDLSPALLTTQAKRCPRSVSLQGSGTRIPLPDCSIDGVLSNEVLADLRSAPDLEGWSVTPAPGQRLFNTGSWAMIREISRVLRPGGWAYLSEFGAVDELPEETTHLDHPEVSIHFGQLKTVAESLGLQAQLVPLGTLLNIDREALWLSRASTEALRALYHRHGSRLTAHASSPESAVFPWPIEGLWWVPVRESGCAPMLDRLWTLLVRKPA